MGKRDLLGLHVSRETYERLEHFERLVLKWSPRINLISKADHADIWARHILDSAQIYSHIPNDAQIHADLGSGGGFPGVVLSILNLDTDPKRQTVLLESDKRKATFLRTAIRETGCSAKVIDARIEDIPALSADVVTARALAPLEALLPMVAQHIKPDGCALLPKGVGVEKELERARERHHFQVVTHPSLTDPRAQLLEIRGLHCD